MDLKFHYHVLLLLNKDAYAFLGNVSDLDINDNLISKNKKGMGKDALNGDYEQCWYLVRIPESQYIFSMKIILVLVVCLMIWFIG